MNLENDFIFFSTIIIILLLPLYRYRKRVFKFYYQENDISSFIKDIQIYLKRKLPKITFSYEILKKLSHEKDFRIKQTLIIEDIIKQFSDYKYSTVTQNTIKHDLLWASYENDSKPPKDKVPKDLIRRKELSWRRDNQSCDRCGQKIKLLDSHLCFARKLEDGGTYHFENLAILCSDCYRINTTKSNISDLHLENVLMEKATF